MPLTIPAGYTSAQLALLTRDTIGRVLAGGQRVRWPDGKDVTQADLSTLWTFLVDVETAADDETAAASGGIALAVYGERV